MRVVILLCIVFTVGNCAPNYEGLTVKPSLDGKIVGGEPVEIYDHPYQAALLYFGSQICGAAIITSRFLLTTGHCVYGGSAPQFTVRVGSSFPHEGGHLIQVESITLHPDFVYATLDFDLAILRLSSALNQDSTVGFIQMVSQGTVIPEGIAAVVSGWGALEEDGAYPDQLQAVSVYIISQQVCRELYGESSITDNMICAGVDGGGKDACIGDSGGPLTVNRELVGLVSWGYGCARPYFPGVYTNLAALRDWVRTITGA